MIVSQNLVSKCQGIMFVCIGIWLKSSVCSANDLPMMNTQ